jgi:hypothetical protein
VPLELTTIITTITTASSGSLGIPVMVLFIHTIFMTLLATFAYSTAQTLGNVTIYYPNKHFVWCIEDKVEKIVW